MDIIYQRFSDSCTAACMAMLTGNTEQYVLDWFEFYDPPFSLEDCFIFLAHHGIYLCTDFLLTNDSYIDHKFIALLGFTEREMLIFVKTDKELLHAILWDGEKVIDPDPFSTKTDISEYEVVHIYPVMKSQKRIENEKN